MESQTTDGKAAAKPKPNFPEGLPSLPGTYALVLICQAERPLSIGRLGNLQLQQGIYVYVGSAFGPGGLRSRLVHHLQLSARPHWHLDYLRPFVNPREFWYSTAADRQEHLWAQLLMRSRGARQPLVGFGASDCSCPTHLFYFSGPPSFAGFHRRLRQISDRRATLKCLNLPPTLSSPENSI